MWLENKDYIIDPNGGEKIKIKSKKELANLEAEIVPKFSNIKKITSAMLMTTMMSANNIDTSKLPHYAGLDDWVKKHVKIKIEKVKPRTIDDYDRTFNPAYYEKYNPNAKRLENSYYCENIDFASHIAWWRMKFYRINYGLVNVRRVNFSRSFLKLENLDKVPVNINWETYIEKPKFLELDFGAIWRHGHMIKETWKRVVLVYVPYKSKIIVLGSIVDGEFYEENRHRVYDISPYHEKYKRELYTITKLFRCGITDCYITEKDINWDRYIYKKWKEIWIISDFWNEKIIKTSSWRKLWKILERWNKEIIFDNHENIISEFSGTKQVHIKLQQTDMDMRLYVK